MSKSSTEEKKIVLITGCSKGSIGDALAQEFLRRGLHVIATGRSLERVQHLQDMGCQTAILDITSTESIQNLSKQVGRLDILFNNAGIVFTGPLTDTKMSDLKEQFDTNFFGPVELTQVLLPLLIKSKGIIVNHTSQSPYGIGVMLGAYAASKAALANLTDNLRIELAPFGIRVVQLVTGVASSNITREFKPRAMPPDSLYTPIKAEIEKALAGRDVAGKEMAGDVYAKKVVGDLLGGRSPPVWIWRGSFASTMYCVWLLGCFWKGLFDSPISRLFGLQLLPARLKEPWQQR